MSRTPKQDSPNTWLHLMDRDIVRRTLFEHSADMSLFLVLIAETTERGEWARVMNSD